MGKRIASAAVGIVILLFILVSGHFLEPALGIIVLIALTEIYKALGLFRKIPICSVGILGCVAMLVAFHFNTSLLLPIVCAMIIVLLILAVCWHKQISFHDIAVLLFSTLYVTLPLAHISLVAQSINGNCLIYTIFIAAFMTDTGAYFIGCCFGKHKLIPTISPNKTIEGAVGGVIFSVLGFAVFGWVMTAFLNKQVCWSALVITAVLTSVIAQFGDLSASMIKREMHIKDYGSIFPGHGGVLDRFDSVLFVAPTIYYLMQLMPILI